MQHEWKERLVNKRMRKSKEPFLLQTKLNYNYEAKSICSFYVF